MSRRLLAPALLVLILPGAGVSRADPRLDEIVYSPWVQNGTLELETRLGRLQGGPDKGAMTNVEEIEYGVNDRWSVSLLGSIEKPAGESSRLDAIGVESVVYLGQIPRTGVDSALYLEYRHGLIGEPDVAEGKLLFGKHVGRFEGLLNLIVERPIGPRNDEHFASWGYAASATWRTWGRLRLGAEAFGDFGDDHSFGGRQGAYLGPQIRWEGKPRWAPAELEIDAGWLAAVGRDRGEANNQLKINLELERRF